MRQLLAMSKSVLRQRPLFAAALLTLTLLTNPSHAADLQGIEVIPAADSTEVILQLNEKVRYKQQYLPGSGALPNRCYIDLYSTAKSASVPAQLMVENQQLSKIRTGVHATTVRVVLDLKDNYLCVVEAAASPAVLRMLVIAPDATPVSQAGSAATETATTGNSPLPAAVEEPPSEPTTKLSPQPASETDPENTEVVTEMETSLEQPDPPAMAQVSFWGWAQLFTAQDTAADRAEDDQLSRLRARLGADWKTSLSADYALQLKAAVDLDRIFYAAEQAEKQTDLNLHETYLQLNGASWDISFGKQRVRWGKSDQLSPVDSINPQDYRQSLVIDLEERAIPSWLLRNRWYGENIGLETILQPWFQKSEMEYFDSDWALYRNLRQAILTHPTVPPFLKSYASSLYVAEDQPANSLENMSAGLRLTLQTEQTDYALSYHYGWETLPTISSFPVTGINYNGDPNSDTAALLAAIDLPTTNRIEASYNRQQTVGFEWETVLDPVGFRGEIAYSDKVAFMRSDLTSTRKAVTHLVSGIDYTSENEWYFNLQGSWQHIHDFSKEILYFEGNTLAILGEISKPVWRGNLELGLKYNYIATDQSSYLQPSATLKYFRNVECEIGAMIYSGEGETVLGSYDDADQVYAVIKYTF